MSENSRKEILDRIKTGLHNSTAVQGIEEKTPLFPLIEKEIVKQEKKRTLIDRFIDELTKVSGKALITKSGDEIRELIIRLVEKQRAKSLAIWDSDLLKQLNLRQFLQGRGLEFASPKSKEEMARVDIGITEADFAIADTGTIVLIANEKQPRSVSLIPPIHVALMRSDIIVENMEDLFILVKNSLSKSGSIAELTSCITFITGPSRTADIELNLTLGVHGPKEIIVLIIID